MKPARSLAGLLSFVLLMSFSAHAESSKSEGTQRLIVESGGTVRVRVDEETGLARFVDMQRGNMRSAAINNRAMRPNHRAGAFLREYGDAFGIRNVDSELKEMRTTRDHNGVSTTVHAQTYEGVPVFGGEIRTLFNPNGEMTAVNSKFLAGLKVNTKPAVARDIAEGRAIRAVIQEELRKFQASLQVTDVFRNFDENDYNDLYVRASDLMVYRTGLARGVPGTDHLAYRVEVRNASGTIREFVFIDAHSSKVVDQITGIYDALDRRAYDAEGSPHPGPNYPAMPFWVEGDPLPTTDVEADNMIYASEETYNLFNAAFGRDSFDGLGATMDAIFNRGDSCPNASWNGTYISFCPGLTTDDVTGHEWAHAYTEYTNNLVYAWQSGALNESYSDIWGELVDLVNSRDDLPLGGARVDGACAVQQGGSDDSTRWLLGEDSTAPGLIGALRDMWTPTCFGDPGKVSDDEYWCTAGDNGGVHFNSGVPNHAFTLMVDGGSYNGESIAGIGMTKAAHVQWTAQNMLTPTSDFADNADALEAACSSLVGIDLADLVTGAASGEVMSAADCGEVAKAVSAVEMRLAPSQCGFEPLLQPDAPALCEGLGSTQTIFAEDFESGALPAGWTVGSYGVADPATFDSTGWEILGDLPSGANGLYAAVAPDLVAGDCAADTEAGVVTLESPDIVLPAMQVPHVAFDHYVATEAGWDGGNLKVSVNGGPWTLVPASDYAFNPYNGPVGGDNPMSGQDTFTGANEGELSGSWGQSQVNLFGLALPGDTVRLRFDLGTDGCNGLDGWYVDEVQVYSCSAEPLPVCGDGKVEPGEICDDGNNNDGDGCSASCGVEEGWACTSSTPASNGGNILKDWSFEGGVPNADWTPFSTFTGIAGFPLCGPGNGCPAAGLASTGAWNAWIGGLPGVTSDVTQTVQIPASATELTVQVLRGVCDDPSDTLHITIDGNDIGSVACDVLDSGFVQHTFPLAPYNDNAMHDLSIGGTLPGLNGTHSNFFVDDVYIEGNVVTPAKPSLCTRKSDNLACNVSATGFDSGIPDTWVVVDNEGTGVVWSDIEGSFIGGNWIGTEGDAASVSSDAAGPFEFDTELHSNTIDLRNAKSASVTYQVDYQNFGDLDFLDLDISTDNGATWTNLLSWNEDHPPGGLFVVAGETATVDLSAYVGYDKVKLRWRYYDPNTGDWDWYAQVDDVGLSCDTWGRMTGGGFVKQDGVNYHHAMALRCDDSAKFNWMQVWWGKGRDRQRFKLEELTSAVCSDQPGVDPAWPKAPFDTFVGEGFGTLNGKPAQIEFRVSDAGEPGRNDEVRYTITGEDGVTVSGTLKGGNHQARRLGTKWKP